MLYDPIDVFWVRHPWSDDAFFEMLRKHGKRSVVVVMHRRDEDPEPLELRRVGLRDTGQELWLSKWSRALTFEIVAPDRSSH